MDPITQQAVLATAGAGGSNPLYVDDVFSTYLYDGTEANKTITNGIDLAGEGGMVWIKARTDTRPHFIFDTERGVQKRIIANDTFSEATATNSLTQFNNNGFNLGDYGDTNKSGQDMCAWTFRKAPGFFDVVTYTGNGSSRTIAHNLGSVPGMIIVKSRTQTEGWKVWHRSLTDNQKFLNLHEAGTPETSSTMWNNTAPTSTHFSLGNNYSTNNSGKTYVAYVFAHDDASFGTGGNESIIKCGSYTGTSTAGNFINLGCEPQWLMIKPTQNSGGWMIFDNMRGVVTGGTDKRLEANATGGDIAADTVDFNSTGFTLTSTSSNSNTNGNTYIYMAIRRPNKPPTVGTEVFGAATQVPPVGNQGAHRSGFVADMAIRRRLLVTTNNFISSRLLSGKQLSTNTNSAESAEVDNKYDYMNGYFAESDTSTDKIAWLFKRAPGFFDVVAYKGSSPSSQTIPHNLDVIPELIITKSITANFDWGVYSSTLGAGSYLTFNESSAANTSSTYWNSTAPTSSVFSVGDSPYTNSSYQNTQPNMIAYLFATLPGISKVGSYTGTGSAMNIDCGFTNGARFVMIKRTDGAFDWNVFDTARGITAGNDPYLALNSSAAQYSAADRIDPLPSGFTVSTTFADYNAVGGNYIFLAIA